jgi:hypothetical protein
MLSSAHVGGLPPAEAEAKAEGDVGLAEARADGAGGTGAQIAPLVDLSDPSPVVGKLRALSKVSGAEPS